MIVRKLLPICFFGAIALTGCDGQKGRFYDSGEEFLAFQSNDGGISIVDGRNAKPANEAESGGRHLFYILIICPGIRGNGSRSSHDMGRYVTTLNWSWNDETAWVCIQLQWNRYLDMVTIGAKNYDRDKGNVFVIRRETSGEIVSQQFPSIEKPAAFPDVLRYIQQQITNDQLIASLKLYK